MGGQRRRKGRKVPGGGERPFVTQPEEASPGVGVGGGMSCDGRVQCDGRERGAGAQPQASQDGTWWSELLSLFLVL